jgi:molybdopterin synthase catalytic subunit
MTERPDVQVAITDGPLPPASAQPAPTIAGAGATLVFDGIVREREGEAIISALDYTVYEPMAQNMLARIGAESVDRFGLIGLSVQHSRGQVAVGECSFRLTIHAKHRKEALAAMDWFIDRLKQDVPIWKSPVWAE